MRIVLTGATGFVGRELVPLLRERGHELLLVGRDPQKSAAFFPAELTCGYPELAQKGSGYDMIVHLAVANSDAELDETGFREANVQLLNDTLRAAREAGIARFINISSIHALDDRKDTLYARTKREAVDIVSRVNGIDAVTVFLPPVYGAQWAGKLALLNRLPRWLARLASTPLAALTPTVSVRVLADFITSEDAPSEPQLILSDGQSSNIFYRIVKRFIDLAFAVGVTVLLWWLLLAVWVLIRLQSPGPGIFAQTRVGRHGEEFTCYKFRTMKLGTVQAATNEVSASSVTRLGHFLRKTKIDELPQIWNIFRNEISLIGPRPCLPVQTLLIEERARRGVFTLKPGISGLAQVNGIDMSDPEKLARWDQRYLRLQSLVLDVKIALATATGRGQGDNVVREK